MAPDCGYERADRISQQFEERIETIIWYWQDVATGSVCVFAFILLMANIVDTETPETFVRATFCLQLFALDVEVSGGNPLSGLNKKQKEAKRCGSHDLNQGTKTIRSFGEL